MIRIKILNSLRDSIQKTFKGESQKVYSLIDALRDNPQKGKLLAHIGLMHLRELRYKSFRFYYVYDSHELLLYDVGKVEELLLQVLAMSKKNNQQRVIDQIKEVLKRIKD